MEQLAREEPSHPLVQAADAPDSFMDMLGRKGAESETAVLESLAARTSSIIDLSSVRGAKEDRVAATTQALASQPDVIYQAPLSGGGFFGVADFLVRVPGSGNEANGGGGGKARYMVWDAKLARQPRPSQVLQLCCYAEMLERLQGAPVERVGLILGATPLTLRTASYAAFYRHTRARFLAAADDFDASATPGAPDPGAPSGRWSGVAAAELMRLDDLRLVARLSRRQASRLRAAGITTASELADLTEDGAEPRARIPDVAGVTPALLRRLARQAALQRRGRATPDEPPPFELLHGACAPGNGLGALPWPHPEDVFFDLEGFPFATLPATAGGALPDLVALSEDVRATTSAGGEAAGAEDGTSGSAGSSDERAVVSGGREYLWGISLRPAPGVDVSQPGEYVSWWAHDARGEKAAFVAAVDWMLDRRRQAPNSHIYHYGAYELSVLRRLSGRYGMREAEVDELLRSGALIDLYDVVRHALLLGEPRYSIKNVERLYRPAQGRDTAVAKGDQSVAVYAQWLDSPDGVDVSTSATLCSLAEYNRDDCESTRQLADWLWAVRMQRCSRLPTAAAGATQDAAALSEDESDVMGAGDDTSAAAEEEEMEVRRLETALLESADGWPTGSALADENARETLAGMLRYHRREAKPQWWRRFDWLDSPPQELIVDARTLGGLVRTKSEAYKAAPRKRRLAYEYAFEPTQEVNLAAGGPVVLRDDAPLLGGAADGDDDDGIEPGDSENDGGETGDVTETLPATLLSLDRSRGLAILECSVPPPPLLSALPNEFVDGAPVARALRAQAAAMVEAPSDRTALGEILARRTPRVAAIPLADGAPSANLEQPLPPFYPGSGEDPVAAAVAATLSLRRSYLCVQGPPGTGKSYTGAQCISALVREGRRVGVMAVSHRAISNLVTKAIDVVGGGGSGGRCGVVKIGGAPSELEELQAACEAACDAAACGGTLSARQIRGASALLKGGGLEEHELIVGGTAWAFSSEAMAGTLDVLFVDEAGQLPLAQLAGAARSAQSIVLLGDQMQLPAPSEGYHPGDSGASCLDYLLQGLETVPPSMGIFLPTSYRMHPELCRFVSELSYGGLLRPHASTKSREIELADTPSPMLSRGVGIVHLPVEHEGNTQASEEEVAAVKALCAELLRGGATLKEGDTSRLLAPSDVLVVAPYNLQVRLLEAALPDGVRVGTVDRFQGQEAPVVLFTSCHSDFTSGAATGPIEDAGAAAGSDERTGTGAAGGERGLSFVLNINRLNVALSRAQCLAVVVGSPRLVDTPPKTLQQQRELNALCRILEAGREQATAERPISDSDDLEFDWAAHRDRGVP